MSGLQEILVIILVIVFILFLPRLTGRGKKTSSKTLQTLPGKLRLAIVASVIWLLLWSTYFKPWNGEILAFALFGLCPIILGWGAIWIIDGFKKKQDV